MVRRIGEGNRNACDRFGTTRTHNNIITTKYNNIIVKNLDRTVFILLLSIPTELVRYVCK